MSIRTPKHEILEQLALIGTALSSPVRLELVELLSQGEQTVQALASLTGTTVANTSQHLQKLKAAGLIVGRKQAQQVFYRIASDDVVALLATLGAVGQKHLAEIERIVRLYFLAKDDLEPVCAEELLERAHRGLATVLDVRPADEFAAGHVPGAVNIPIEELDRRLRELPKGREVVAYCRGPFCLMSFEAVELLRKRGRKARRLRYGMPEWRLAGMPVERSLTRPA